MEGYLATCPVPRRTLYLMAPGGVPDETWAEAEQHYDPAELAALLTAIATITVWNVLNAAVRTPPGALRTATTPA
jgi:hypothetical protein